MQFLLGKTLLLLYGWVEGALLKVLLFFDVIIYSVADESYKMFDFAYKYFNLSNIGGLLETFRSRCMALVAIIMLFKLIMIVIQYTVEPEKINDKQIGTSSVVKNIMIVVAMLILVYSNTLFGFFKDIQILLLGSSDQLTVIPSEIFSESDTNVIKNFVFGDSDNDVSNFGREITANMLGGFLYIDENGDDQGRLWSSYVEVYGELSVGASIPSKFETNEQLFYYISQGVVPFTRLLSDDLNWDDSKLKYVPFVSGIAGIYMIYVFFTYTIDILIRAFKLFIMEIISPLAIIAYVDPSKGKTVFNNFFKKYFEIYAILFMKVLMIYLSVIIINTSITKLFETLSIFDGIDWLTRMFLYLLAVIAVFRFMKEAPKLISDIFGIHLDDKKGSFGKILGATVGAAGGALVGAGIGVGSAIKAGGNGWSAAFQGLSGAVQGGVGGGTSKNFGDFFKKQASSGKGIIDRSYKMKDMGGVGNYVRGAVGSTLGGNRDADRGIARLDKDIASLDKKAGIYSSGDSLANNLDNAINSEFEKNFGSMDSYMQRGGNAKDYTDLRNDFANAALNSPTDQMNWTNSGTTVSNIDISAINRAQKQYNDHVDRNESFYKDSSGNTIKITDFASIKTSKDKSAAESAAIARNTGAIRQQQKDIKEGRMYMRGDEQRSYRNNSDKAQQRRAQQYKDNEAYKGNEKSGK